MDDLDDLLAGGNTLGDTAAERLGLDIIDEFFGDVVVDVGFKQGDPHLAKRVRDVSLGQLAVTAQVLENLLQFAGERFEHGAAKPSPIRRG